MLATRSLLSTRTLAEVIGVSESSIKRWVDEGRVQAQRTAGGHRRIPVEEAVRFLRTSGLRVLRPDLLGVGVLAGLTNGEHSLDAQAAPLFEALRAGEMQVASGILTSLFLDGASIAEIVDGPLSAAMAEIGELWTCSTDGVFIEHRATDIVLQGLRQLRALLPPRSQGAPVAVGGAPQDDPYSVATLAAALLLEAEGFAVTHLGPKTPYPALLEACNATQPRLVWLSATSTEQAADLASGVDLLTRHLGKSGATLAVGGRALSAIDLPSSPVLRFGKRMADLEATARAILAA